MLLLILELVRLLGSLETKLLLLNDWMNILGLNRSAHLLHLLSGANIDTTDGTDGAQDVEHLGSVGVREAADHADYVDDTVVADGREGLLKSGGSADLNDEVDTLLTGSEGLCGGAPGGVGAVVDDVVGTELLELLLLLGGGGGGDNDGTGSLSELEGYC